MVESQGGLPMVEAIVGRRHRERIVGPWAWSQGWCNCSGNGQYRLDGALVWRAVDLRGDPGTSCSAASVLEEQHQEKFSHLEMPGVGH